MSGALHGIKVLEISEWVSGPYCGKLMADLGADVIKVEPPRGDIARRLGPFPGDESDPEASGLFLYVNTNKRGITLDLSSKSAKGPLERLASWADVIITNYSPLEAADLGVAPEDLHALASRTIVTSITPFGASGPHSAYRSYYLNTFHGAGEGYCLPGGIGWLLYSHREPIKAAGYLGEYDVGVNAAVATLAALVGRGDGNAKSETIDISAQEALLDMMRYELASFNDGWIESRATRALPVGGLIQCEDGFVEIMPLEERMWNGLIELMGNPEWASDPKYAYTKLMENFLRSQDVLGKLQMDVNDHISEWALQHSKREIYHQGQQLGCAIGMVLEAEELFSDPQLAHRHYFAEIDHPRAGRLVYAGAPYLFSETPATYRTGAPLLGQHNEEVYCSLFGYSREDLAMMRASATI